jgi:Mannosyltransferase (PIG-V)
VKLDIPAIHSHSTPTVTTTPTRVLRASGARILQSWRSNRQWMWSDVLVPLLLTRLALLFVGWFSQILAPSPDFPLREVVARGWIFSPYRLLDIWGRWDSGWYASIALEGYHLLGDIYTTQSNIAFFPLMPHIVRFLIMWIPASLLTPGVVLFAGVIVSNLFLVGAMILLHRLTASCFDAAVARRAVLYLLLFPTGFFLSAFYTEAAFLFLSLAAFYAATKKAWPAACVMGALLAMTRAPGVLVAVPLVWMYAESLEWRLQRVGWELLWFLLIPAGLLSFLISIYPLTGNLLATIIVHINWNHYLAALPLETILNTGNPNNYLALLEQWTSIALLAAIVLAWKWLPSKAYSIYVALLMLLPLTAGILTSMIRYALVMFPAFIVLALLGKNPTVDRWVIILLMAVQVLFMALWSQFYWVS